MKSLRAFLGLIRYGNVLTTFLIVFLTAGKLSGFSGILFLLAGSVSAAAAAAAGNIINDVLDIETDKINRPERALPSGNILLGSALLSYRVAVLISLGVSVFLGFYPFLVVLSANVLLFLYSYLYKGRVLIGNFIIALMAGLLFVFAGIISAGVSRILYPSLFAFLVTFMRELIKDAEDTEGDSVTGMKTLVLVYGKPAGARVILFFGSLLILLTLLSPLSEKFTIEFYVLSCLIINPMIVYAIKLSFDYHQKESLRKASNVLKLAMLTGLAGIVGSI